MLSGAAFSSPCTDVIRVDLVGRLNIGAVVAEVRVGVVVALRECGARTEAWAQHFCWQIPSRGGNIATFQFVLTLVARLCPQKSISHGATRTGRCRHLPAAAGNHLS